MEVAKWDPLELKPLAKLMQADQEGAAESQMGTLVQFLAIPSDPKERKGNTVTFGQYQSLVGLLPTSKHLEP